MNHEEYRALDGIGLAELIEAREIGAAELAGLATDLIEHSHKTINAVTGMTPQEAGRALERGGTSPLAGVPFLVKDIGLSMEGVPSEFGSRLAADYLPPHDDALARRIKQAGLVTLGRTSTPEFGINITTEPVSHGPTANPWNPRHIAGGSSGGAAAAVAAGLVPLAHANDGGGSIRIPAHYCGLFGLKPSRGRVSSAPNMDEAFFGLGTQLVVSRSVRDSAAAFDLMAGREPGDRFFADGQLAMSQAIRERPRPLRILFWTQPPEGAPPVDEDYLAALQELAEHLRRLGHSVSEASPPVTHEASGALFRNLTGAGTAHMVPMLASALSRPIDDSTLEQATLRWYEHGARMSAVDLLHALDELNAVTRAVGPIFQDHDLIMSPVARSDAPLLGRFNQNAAWESAEAWAAEVFSEVPFTAIFNVTGQPAMSVPLGLSPRGLPWGAQFAADMGQESLLFSLAAQIEHERPWPRLAP